jgi:hypothetical protein
VHAETEPIQIDRQTLDLTAISSVLVTTTSDPRNLTTWTAMLTVEDHSGTAIATATVDLPANERSELPGDLYEAILIYFHGQLEPDMDDLAWFTYEVRAHLVRLSPFTALGAPRAAPQTLELNASRT